MVFIMLIAVTQELPVKRSRIQWTHLRARSWTSTYPRLLDAHIAASQWRGSRSIRWLWKFSCENTGKGFSPDETHLRNQALKLRHSDYSPAIDNLFKGKKNRASLSTYTFHVYLSTKGSPALVPAPDIVKRSLLECFISSLSHLEYHSFRLMAKIVDFKGDFFTQVTDNILNNCHDEKRLWIG